VAKSAFVESPAYQVGARVGAGAVACGGGGGNERGLEGWVNRGWSWKGIGRYWGCMVGWQALNSIVSGHEVLKVGDTSSELFLRHSGRLFGGLGKTFGESKKLIKAGGARENERCGIQDDVVRHRNVICI
jgi:hypothetical protein